MSDDFAALLFFFGISMTLNLTLGFAWFRANRRMRRLEDHVLGVGQAATPEDRRVDQMERAMDSLSAQMDQLANGQDFLNRVMADRLDKLPREAVREVTPH